MLDLKETVVGSNFTPSSLVTENISCVDLQTILQELQTEPATGKPILLRNLPYAILLITTGEANHQVDFKKCILRENDCLIISPGQVHAFDQKSSYEGKLILFTEYFLGNYLAADTISRVWLLYNYFLGVNSFHRSDGFQEFIERIEKEILRAADTSPNILGSMLSVFLLKLSAVNAGLAAVTNKEHLHIFDTFRRDLVQHHSRSHDAKFYSDLQGVSYKHLNVICKNTLGKTAKELISDYILLECKRHLLCTTSSSKDISAALGFDEPTNFLKFFKKRAKKTPGELRKKGIRVR